MGVDFSTAMMLHRRQWYNRMQRPLPSLSTGIPRSLNFKPSWIGPSALEQQILGHHGGPTPSDSRQVRFVESTMDMYFVVRRCPLCARSISAVRGPTSQDIKWFCKYCRANQPGLLWLTIMGDVRDAQQHFLDAVTTCHTCDGLPDVAQNRLAASAAHENTTSGSAGTEIDVEEVLSSVLCRSVECPVRFVKQETAKRVFQTQAVLGDHVDF